MTKPNHTVKEFDAVRRSLPELDGESFTQSVIHRTQRIRLQRKITQVLAYFAVTLVCVAALPWQSLVADFNNLSNIVAVTLERLPQIYILTEQLQMGINFQNVQAQQIAIVAACACALGCLTSYLMTEA